MPDPAVHMAIEPDDSAQPGGVQQSRPVPGLHLLTRNEGGRLSRLASFPSPLATMHVRSLLPLLLGAGFILAGFDGRVVSQDTLAQPGLRWGNGSDLHAAGLLGYVTDLSTSHGGTSVQLAVRGAPEVLVVIDDLLHIDNPSHIPVFTVQVTRGLADGSVKRAVLRFWTGSTPPQTDGEALGVLELRDTGGTAVSMPGEFDTVKVQLVLGVGSGTVAIRDEVTFTLAHAATT